MQLAVKRRRGSLGRGVGENLRSDCAKSVCGAIAHINIAIQKGGPNGRHCRASLRAKFSERKDGGESACGIRVVGHINQSWDHRFRLQFQRTEGVEGCGRSGRIFEAEDESGDGRLCVCPYEGHSSGSPEAGGRVAICESVDQRGHGGRPNTTQRVDNSGGESLVLGGAKELGERRDRRRGARAEDSEGAVGRFGECELPLVPEHPASEGAGLSCSRNARESIGNEPADSGRMRTVSNPFQQMWKGVCANVVNGFLGGRVGLGVGGVQRLDPIVQGLALVLWLIWASTPYQKRQGDQQAGNDCDARFPFPHWRSVA